MSGVRPYHYLMELSCKLESLTGRDEIEEALDMVEYLFEVIPPELQDQAESLIEILNSKLAAAGAAGDSQ